MIKTEKENQSLVSVIISTHNRAELLSRAVDSVLAQTYKDFECIIVADNCADNTDEIITSYIETDNRIKYIKLGAGESGKSTLTRNAGLEVSKGEYIAFLDDDDAWTPTKLERQVEVIESDPQIGLVTGGYITVFSEQGIRNVSKTIVQGDLSEDIVIHNYIGVTSAVLFRKSLIDEAGTWDQSVKLADDWDLWIRLCQYCKVASVSEPVLYYYVDLKRAHVSINPKNLIDDHIYLDKKYESLIEKLSDAQKLEREYLRLLSESGTYHKAGMLREARYCYRKALAIHFSMKKFLKYFLRYMHFDAVLRIRRMMMKFIRKM